MSQDQFYKKLSNDLISLVPITKTHIEEMKKLSRDSDIWTWYTEDLSDPEDLALWMTKRLEQTNNGEMMTYAVVFNDTEEIIGATSYGHIDWEEKGIEIGWTWLGADFIGAGINKHMKFLMLKYAFENMEIERLELRTDATNIRSRKAMEKIGAQHDGTLRNHRKTRGDRRRDTVVYSIIKSEWSEIRTTIFGDF